MPFWSAVCAWLCMNVCVCVYLFIISDLSSGRVTNGLCGHLNKYRADLHTIASNGGVPFRHSWSPAVFQSMLFLVSLWNCKVIEQIALKKSKSCGWFPNYQRVIWQNFSAGVRGLAPHNKAQGDWMHVVHNPERRAGSGAEGCQWWKSKRFNKVIGLEFFLALEIEQTRAFLLTACYTARGKHVKKLFVLVQILRMTFPSTEELKIKSPEPLSSLHVYYWSLRETEYWLGRPLIDLITFLQKASCFLV